MLSLITSRVGGNAKFQNSRPPGAARPFLQIRACSIDGLIDLGVSMTSYSLT